jgi:hypothetical protein
MPFSVAKFLIPSAVKTPSIPAASFGKAVLNADIPLVRRGTPFPRVNPAIAPPTVPIVSAFSICFASSSLPCSLRSSLA